VARLSIFIVFLCYPYYNEVWIFDLCFNVLGLWLKLSFDLDVLMSKETSLNNNLSCSFKLLSWFLYYLRIWSYGNWTIRFILSLIWIYFSAAILKDFSLNALKTTSLYFLFTVYVWFYSSLNRYTCSYFFYC
jgi:hypothetical protein